MYDKREVGRRKKREKITYRMTLSRPALCMGSASGQASLASVAGP